MIELSVIRDLVAIFGVLAGFSYYVLTVRNNQRNQRQQLETRQAQLFMQAYGIFTEKEFQKNWFEMVYQWYWDDYDDFMAKYGPQTNSEEASKWGSVLAYFESLGVFVEQKLIDIELVSRLGSYNIINCWEKFSPVFEEYTRRSGDPYTYDYLEWLYNELKTKRHVVPDVFEGK
jgi:hypothetical protein